MHQRSQYGRFVAVASCAFVLVVEFGCGSDDAAARDYGSYSPHRTTGDYDSRASRSRGILAESVRLGGNLVRPVDVDPELTMVQAGGVDVSYWTATDNALSVAASRTEVMSHALGNFGIVAVVNPDEADHRSNKLLGVSLTAFAGEQEAAAAADDLDRSYVEDDETGSSDPLAAAANDISVSSEAFPAAKNRWHPRSSALGSVMAWKSLVIRVYVKLPDSNLAVLMDRMAQTYRQQLAELEKFTPTPAADIPTLPLDPHRLLPRLVKTGNDEPDAQNFAVYDVRAYSAIPASPAADFETNYAHGVTEVAVSYNTRLFHLRDATAATDYGRFLAGERDESGYVPMHPIVGLPRAACSQATIPDPTSFEARRYRCVVVRDADVALLYSNSDTDIRQLAAAQNAVMAS